MRTKMLRSIAVTLAVGACGTAYGQYQYPTAQSHPAFAGSQDPYRARAAANESAGYQSPAKWSHFGTDASPAAATIFQPASGDSGDANAQPLPTPAPPERLSAPAPEEAAPEPAAPPQSEGAAGATGQVGSGYTGSGHVGAGHAGSAHVGSGHAGAYGKAMQSPWGAGAADGYSTLGGRPELYPYFGGANLLFLTLEDDSERRLVTDGSMPLLTTSDVEPDSDVGFDIYAGRYFDCGRYGVSVRYFLFNPDEEARGIPSGMSVAAFPQWGDIAIDDGAGGTDTVYDLFDGDLNAENYRARRDMRFQSLEANFTSFGILGAQRAAAACGGGLGGFLQRCGVPAAWCDTGHGYGGAAGPLVRPTSGRVQVATSHGFRWFEMEDEFQLAADLDMDPGYDNDAVYYDVEADNNLYGYQFGSQITYCLSNRWNLNIGGKFGIYANDVEYRQRIGTLDTLAVITETGESVATEDSDTVLATLGELDLGLGYRMSNAWTVRGGYRLIGLSGVATTTGSLSRDYSSLASAGRVEADDSVILHGGYVGLEFNW